MAKGKKSSGVSYTSKGERGANKNITKALRRDFKNSIDASAAKVDAWHKGLNVMLTIRNEGEDSGKKPFKRVKATEVWGKPQRYAMKSNGGE